MNTRVMGSKCWVIPDGFIPKITEDNTQQQTGYVSHECACMLNTGTRDADIEFTFYFEDREPIRMTDITLLAQRSRHLRIDELSINQKPVIKRAVPYSLVITSSEPIVVQMSRLDTTQENMAFLSILAFPIDNL